MDQIYLPKSRPPGFAAGDFVEIIPTKRKKASFYTYNLHYLEPIKSPIKDEIFDYFKAVDNVLITGSFLEKGFKFEDIDVVLIDGNKVENHWEEYFKERLGINLHLISLDRKSLLEGLKTDPLFQMMMSRYLSKKREIFRYKNEPNYKLLDLHLLKSKELLAGFEVLVGKEKYDLTRNLIAIRLFLKNKKLSWELIDQEINRLFGDKTSDQLKENLIKKKAFLKKFKEVYNQTFSQIIEGIKNESEPK